MSWLKIWLKESYMCLVSLLGKSVSKNIKVGQVTYLYSFSENNVTLLDRLLATPEISRVVILYTKNVTDEVIFFKKQGIRCIEINQLSFFLEGVKELLQSQIVIMDNYFAFLGALSFSKATTKYQLWHANGAIKCFGWQDKQTTERSAKEKRRFQAVYDQADYYVVASKKMSHVFQASYRQPQAKMLEIGLPRTDYFFSAKNKKQAQQFFKEKFPEASGKKVVLYTPTYRDNKMPVVDWATILPKFSEDYLVIAKLHPHAFVETLQNSNGVFYETRGLSLKELLFSVDTLVTDYSSVPFEYSLANENGHTLYYVFDQAGYQQIVGIQADFFDQQKVRVANSGEALITQLPGNPQSTLADWNTNNDGQATTRLIEHIKKQIAKGG